MTPPEHDEWDDTEPNLFWLGMGMLLSSLWNRLTRWRK